MKKLLSVFFALALFACSTANSQTKNLNLDAFVKTYKETKGAVLLDVRTPGEWSAGKIEKSECINVMDPSFADKVSKLDKKTPLFVYCKVGGRSSKASQQLAKMGFTNVHNLTNAGYDNLVQKGLK